MPLQLFLNNLSAPTGAVDRACRIFFLKNLVATVRKAASIDSQLVLNYEMPLNDLTIGDDVTIATLRNDGSCVEESQYLKTLAARAPFSHATAEAETTGVGLFEYRIPASAPTSANLVASALGLAHMLGGLGISFPSHDFWSKQNIELDRFEVDNAGVFANRVVVSRNACSIVDVNAHEDALQKTLRPLFRNGRDLWANRADLFPNLIFIPRTRSQIEGILAGDPLLDQCWIKLSGINQALATWIRTKSAYPLFPFNVRPESKSRLGLVRFNDADGLSRVFSDHADLAPIEGRLHFLVLSEPRRHALIGHVGRKLGIG